MESFSLEGCVWTRRGDCFVTVYLGQMPQGWVDGLNAVDGVDVKVTERGGCVSASNEVLDRYCRRVLKD